MSGGETREIAAMLLSELVDLDERCNGRVPEIKKPQTKEDPVDISLPAGSSLVDRWEEGKRLIPSYAESLLHVSRCVDTECPSSKCKKLKEILEHAMECNERKKKGFLACIHCRGLIIMGCWHADTCISTECPVPFCSEFKGHVMENRFNQFKKRALLYVAQAKKMKEEAERLIEESISGVARNRVSLSDTCETEAKEGASAPPSVFRFTRI